MRTFIWIGVFVLILGGAYLFMQNAEAPVVEEGKQKSGTALLPSATFEVPESDAIVTLQNGEALFEIAPESSTEGSISLVPDTIVEWANGERTDVAAVFAVDSGGSGTFLYLVLFDFKNGVLSKKSEMYLGDRILITRVGVGELVQGDADYRITVQTLIRGEGEAYASTPDVPKTRTFYVKDQILEEIETGRDDT